LLPSFPIVIPAHGSAVREWTTESFQNQERQVADVPLSRDKNDCIRYCFEQTTVPRDWSGDPFWACLRACQGRSRSRFFRNLIAILIEGSEMLEAVNVVFGKLAADVLRSALTNCGRSEDIVVFPDDLSCGPLNPLGDARETWMQNNLYLSPGDWGVFPRQFGDLFNNLKFQHGRIICWVCPNSVNEFCGFQQCIEQISRRFILRQYDGSRPI
jgi:hypothetical protein